MFNNGNNIYFSILNENFLNHKMTQVLGSGAYGTVEKRGEYAVKTISHTCFLAQEYAALMKLRNAKHVLQAHKIDWNNKEIFMDLYDMSMRKWLNSYRDVNKYHKIAVSIIKGLAEIHHRGLIHGDLKPGNILINLEPFEVVIGDLGLVSPHKYSRCHCTALPFRDPVIVEDSSHDIFSLGIIFLGLFGNTFFNEAPTYENVNKLIKAHLPEGYKELVTSMTQPDHKKRPNVFELYNIFTGKDLKLSILESLSSYKPPKTEFSKLYKLVPRPYKAYVGACLYSERHREYKPELIHGASSYMSQLLFSKKSQLPEGFKLEELLEMGFKMLEDNLYINCVISRSVTKSESV